MPPTRRNEKIDEIAVGILRKNLKIVRQLEKMESRDIQLKERINHAKEQLDVVKIHLDRDSYSTRYKVVSQNLSKTNEKKASIIADAILFDPQAIQLVASFDGSNK